MLHKVLSNWQGLIKIKGKNTKTKYLIKENWSLIYTIFKQDKTNFKT